jgi:hypothetical protein
MSFKGKRHAAKDLSLVRGSSQDQATAVGFESDSDSEVSTRNRDDGRGLRPRQSLGKSQKLAVFAVAMPQKRARREAQPAQLAVATPEVASLIPGLDNGVAAPASPIGAAWVAMAPPFSMAAHVPAAGALGLTDLLAQAPRDSFPSPRSVVFGSSLFDGLDSWELTTSDSSVASLEHASSPRSSSSGEGALPFAAAAGVVASAVFTSSDSADLSLMRQ